MELIDGGAGDGPSRSLARPAMVMAVGTTLSRLTGLGRVAALSFALGVAESRLADSYNIANTLPNVIYELVLGGVLTSVFLPVLLQELRTRPHEQAWEAASSLVATSMAILVAVSALTVLAAPWIIRIFTLRVPGSQAVQQQELATFLLRLFAPQVALYGFAAIAAGLLNAHGRFAVPMFAPILNNLVVIASLLLFAVLVRGTPTEGSVQASLCEKLLLGLGTTGGVAAMAAVFWPFLRRLPGRLRRRVDFGHPAVRKLARLSAWTLGYVAVNQIGFTVSLYLANRVQGGPTAYFTAFAFFQLPYGIAAVSIMTALAPTLASLHVDADDQGFRRRLDDGLRLSALVLVPATAAYLVLSGPLIHVLLQHGVMRGASSTLVASVLDMFAVGLLPFSAFALFMRAFYARQDARTPMLVNLVENAVTIALDLLLFPLLAVRGLALAHSLGYLAGATLAGGLLTRRVGSLASRATLAMLVKVAVAAGLAAAAMVAVLGLVGGAVSPGGEQAVAQLLAGGAVGLGVFLLAAWTLGVEELTALQRLLPGS